MTQWEVHPIASIFPPMSAAEFSALKDDIEANGLREAIWTYGGQVIDGRHRLRACAELGREPDVRAYLGEDPVGFVVSLNLHRRHLSESQRQMVGAHIAALPVGANQHSGSANVPTQAQAAQLLNVSERGIRNAKKVIEEGTPELVAAVQEGRMSVSAASTISEAPIEVQREIVARGEREILEAAKQIRLEKAEERRAQIAELKANTPAINFDGRYEVIVIDPPWQMEKIERDVSPNQVAFDYPTMTEAELCTMPIPAAESAHLFCWTTHKHLPSALRILDAWGFRYVCTMVWHKPGGFQPFGLPQYNCEFVLYARKGSPQFVDTKAFPCCFEAPRREHSRKPDEFYDTVRRVTGGARIDIFSREQRDGFEQFGNEKERFAA